jgi:hypothetical protein
VHLSSARHDRASESYTFAHILHVCYDQDPGRRGGRSTPAWLSSDSVRNSKRAVDLCASKIASVVGWGAWIKSFWVDISTPTLDYSIAAVYLCREHGPHTPSHIVGLTKEAHSVP